MNGNSTILLRHEPPDPDNVLRVSIGGTPHTGYYCVFRGDQELVLDLLAFATDALRAAPPLPVGNQVFAAADPPIGTN